MKHPIPRLALLACALSASCATVDNGATALEQPKPTSSTNLGAFSVSLAVKDIAASLAFYEKLGFVKVGGVAEDNWLILRNGSITIGLFQGMFKKNILTFNPGWSSTGETLSEFENVRAIQARLKKQGIILTTETDPAKSGPASITMLDPDGNPVWIDQHVK